MTETCLIPKCTLKTVFSWYSSLPLLLNENILSSQPLLEFWTLPHPVALSACALISGTNSWFLFRNGNSQVPRLTYCLRLQGRKGGSRPWSNPPGNFWGTWKFKTTALVLPLISLLTKMAVTMSCALSWCFWVSTVGRNFPRPVGFRHIFFISYRIYLSHGNLFPADLSWWWRLLWLFFPVLCWERMRESGRTTGPGERRPHRAGLSSPFCDSQQLCALFSPSPHHIYEKPAALFNVKVLFWSNRYENSWKSRCIAK